MLFCENFFGLHILKLGLFAYEAEDDRIFSMNWIIVEKNLCTFPIYYEEVPK